jgi:two-component system response regulator RegA
MAMQIESVLLVDDEVEFVETLAERMRARGLDVEYTTNGKDAIECAKTTTFDAVVLDLAMPGMSGIETLKVLLEDHPDLQIILLTGQATIGNAVEATKLGAVDVFEKPTDIETLVKKIREARVARLALEEKHTLDEIDKIMSSRGW